MHGVQKVAASIGLARQVRSTSRDRDRHARTATTGARHRSRGLAQAGLAGTLRAVREIDRYPVRSASKTFIAYRGGHRTDRPHADPDVSRRGWRLVVVRVVSHLVR